MDVSAWLTGLGMGEHARSFADNEIDAATLADLTADDLKELGVTKLGQRKRLLAAIAALAGGQPQPSPPPPPTPTSAATIPAGERRQDLDEGEELLRKGCVGHNYFMSLSG